MNRRGFFALTAAAFGAGGGSAVTAKADGLPAGARGHGPSRNEVCIDLATTCIGSAAAAFCATVGYTKVGGCQGDDVSNGAEVIDRDQAGYIDLAEIIVQLNRIEQRLILLTGDALAQPVSGVGTPPILGIQQTRGTIVDRLDAVERTVEVNTAIDDRDEANRNAAATNRTKSWPRAATSFRPVS